METRDLARLLFEIKTVEEKFREIQKNPALYGFKNGFSAKELELLDKLLSLSGAEVIAPKEISERHYGIDILNEAIRLEPKNVTYYNWRGILRSCREEDLDNAIADFEAALRIDPNNPTAKASLEELRKKRERWQANKHSQ